MPFDYSKAMKPQSKSKMKDAVAVAAPVAAMVIGAVLKTKKAEPQKSEQMPDAPVSVDPVASAEDDPGAPPSRK